MKSLSVQIPDQIAAELARFVEGGWFASEDEVVRQALREFVQSHRAELPEPPRLPGTAIGQRDDIASGVARERAIDLPQWFDSGRAKDLRARLRAFAADWEQPEMKVYDEI